MNRGRHSICIICGAFSILPTLQSKLENNGAKIYQIDCFGIKDKQGFFDAALQALPMGDAKFYHSQGWASPPNWDAFCDFLWQGLTELKHENVAIFLTNIQQWIEEESPLLQEIIQVFEQVAEAVSTADTFTNTPAIQLQTYLVKIEC